MSLDYARTDAVGLAGLVARGAVSPGELLDEALAAIDRLNPRLNAVVHRFEDRARRRLAAARPTGRFAGVPFLLKDLDLELAGVPLTNGSRLFDGLVPSRDSTLAARYEAAGLVILGRTNSAELGLSFTTEPRAFGPSLNPWDATLSPGGSSGGAAAAVASGMVPMAHATDGGGSIRQPAALTGLFGLKPSRGRTPPGPAASETFFGLAVSHALTRSVRDSAALLDATLAPEPGALHALPAPAVAYERCAERDPAPLRVALQLRPFEGGTVDPDCLRALEGAAHLLASLGHRVAEDAPPLHDVPFTDLFRRLAGALTAGFVDDAARQRGLADPLPFLDPVHAAWVEEGRGLGAAGLIAALDAVHAVGRAYADFFTRHDVILSPVIATRTLPLGWLGGDHRDLDRQVARFRAHAPFTFPTNAAGCPAMSVPFAMDDGPPLGVQVAAAVGREDLLFALAGQIERTRPWAGRLPPAVQPAA